MIELCVKDKGHCWHQKLEEHGVYMPEYYKYQKQKGKDAFICCWCGRLRVGNGL